MRARVSITLKPGVLDPQGKTVQQALYHLDFTEVSDVRMGKYIELELHGLSREKAQQHVKQMCEKLLANTVIECYQFEIDE